MAEPKREAWHVRLRQWAARSLAVLARPDGAAGAIVADNTPYIDDGVNYGLPLALPDWYPAEVRAELVKVAAMREASSVYHHQFDKPYLTGENLSMFPTADPLREWDHQTRREVLSRCHLAYERNPLAGSAIGLTTFFAVGEGFTVTCRNPDVQAVIDEFRANPENAIEQYEKEFCNDLQVDGELFIRFHQDEEGQVVITVVPPWEIDWIETEMGFAKRVKAYHQNGSQSTGKPGEIEAINEDLPAGQVLHVAINKHSYHTRGKSELFRILPWLKAYKDWLEGRARQNHWRGSLLFDVALAGATPQQVAAKRAQYKQPPPPGSLAIHNDKETWSVIDPKVGAADVSEDGRQMKLMSAVGVKLPEYMLSDGENANLASATAQQLPALRKFVDLQDVNVSQVWKPIYRRVILAAIAAGRLTEEVEEYDSQGELVTEELPDAAPAKAPEIDPATGLPKVAAAPKVGPAKKIKAIDAFDVVGPEIETSDPKTLADALAVASGQDWVSAETASQKMGFDYYVEQKKIDKHLRKKQQRMAQGLDTGMYPMPLADFNGEEDGAPGGKPAPKRESETPAVEVAPAVPTLIKFIAPYGNGHVQEPGDLALEVQRMIDERVQEEKVKSFQASEDRTQALGVELGAVRQEVRQTAGELTQRLDDLAEAAAVRETQTLAIYRQMLDKLEEANEPPIIRVDEGLIRRIAERAAQTAVADVDTLAQEVSAKDEHGRAVRLKRVYASGRIVEYAVVRDTDGNIAALQRLQGE